MMTAPVTLVCGVLHPNEEWFLWSKRELEAAIGNVSFFSETSPFSLTDYYDGISPTLFRTFVCFAGFYSAGDLPDLKMTTCAVERRSRTPRCVNLDPGYVNGSRLVLASTKDHAHRIYLRNGIFAEVTLRYRFKKWVSFDYTFPDFASGMYDAFLEKARKQWLHDSRNWRSER